MIRGLRTAASGMLAQQMSMDTIAHNLANVNTTGYKRMRLSFEDLLYEKLRPATSQSGETGTPQPLELGHGSRVVGAERIYAQGESETTNNPLDLVIQGEGFFQFILPDGSMAYSRDGALKVDSEGRLVNAGGYVLEPEITLPQDATSVAITTDGRVLAKTVGSSTPAELGQVLLARFVNPGALEGQGGNLLMPTAAAGDPIVGAPEELGLGRVLQGSLERSNVKVVEEMVALIMAQRAFELNSKAVQSADDMLAIVNNLRRV
ncbi:MAG: flagellar basal-body rod protein FlgG [Candidatus Eisenbacteria bacterium]|nr:flagellar basal-body rod protein FlgG [Candidatus Eisenbacteria bacterium]